MATLLNISPQIFLMRYTRRLGGRLALIESKKNYDCIFLKERRCLVYGVRPQQCRTFPFWPEILVSEAEWEATARECEGIDPEAPLVPLNVIEENLGGINK